MGAVSKPTTEAPGAAGSSFPTRTQRYYYDGDQMVENSQWSGSAEVARKAFVFGDRIDDLVMYLDIGNNLSSYAHKDHLGSVQVLVNGSGAIQESYRYNEYGATTIVDSSFAKLTTTLTSPVGNPHRYTGREQHNSVGGYGNDWYYYRAREYRPEAGQFVARDPLGYVDGSNAFLYVSGSPVKFTDPWGHCGFIFMPPNGAPKNKEEAAACMGECRAQKKQYLSGLAIGCGKGEECFESCISFFGCDPVSDPNGDCTQGCIEKAKWCNGSPGQQGTFNTDCYYNKVCAQHFSCAAACIIVDVIPKPH